MVTVRTNTAANRLELTIDAPLGPEELFTLRSRVEDALGRVFPGFVAAIDLSGIQEIRPESLAAAGKIQAAIAGARPSKMATLVSTPTLKAQLDGMARDARTPTTAIRRFHDRAAWKAFVG